VKYDDVKKVRVEKNLTQKAMSDLLEIPIRTVSDWERGLRTPPEWVCKLIVDALKRLGEKS